MLKKFYHSFIRGDQTSEPAPSRKRKAPDLEDDDVIITQTKRCKQDGNSDRNTGTAEWVKIGLAEWIVRRGSKFSGYPFIDNIVSAPSKIFQRFKGKSYTVNQDSGAASNLSSQGQRQEFMQQRSGNFHDMNRPAMNPHCQAGILMRRMSPSFSISVSGRHDYAASHSPPLPPSPSSATSTTSVTTTNAPHTEPPVCSGGAVGSQPRPHPKTGYVDLPFPLVFPMAPADVIWTQDSQFKMPGPKPMGDPGVRQQNIRRPFRMDQRSLSSGNPMMPSMYSTPPHMSAPGMSPYNGMKPGPPPCGTPGGYQPIFDKLYRQNSNLSSSTNMSESLCRNRLAAKESVRLDEKSRYQQLLQKFTSVNLISSDKGQPRRHTPTPRSSNQTLLGTSIDQVSQTAPQVSLLSTKPEVIEVTAHSSVMPSPIIDMATSDSGRDRLYEAPTLQSTPKVPSNQSNQSGPSVRPKVLIPNVKVNGNDFGNSRSNSESMGSPEIVILDSPPIPRCEKSYKLEEFERSLRGTKYSEEWLVNFKQSYSEQARRRDQNIRKEEVRTRVYKEEYEERDRMLENEIRRRLKLGRRTPAVEDYEYVETSSEEEEEEEIEDEFPELTDEQDEAVSAALVSRPPNQLLSEGFRLQVRRADMETLKGLNWLNDEVVNFYFELIRERGKLDNFPTVHVFNTFFYPKVKNQGQQGVRRWTKSVDIYSFDFIAVPIHLGMHWCLAMVDFEKKAIRYFDSMGGTNNECLHILQKYLQDEHKQKKGTPYDTSDWTLENVRGLPQQMNGSDCGVFTCKYADYVCRRRQITFSQENMPYFRRRMVYEILNKELL